ncbi:radical SAM protein [Geomonas sp. Red32]|uniref:lipid biosynthesis B12-binding/radical SAM protein n=1 Tax=Geomonas sp. Red32 TaxID=2912856 RepID=UPI00202CBC2D|nr:lipid biosynthesis B12-binding/radical SAM protein [Geomonas sp. Red32]MCM0083087.1 radical SAM protein [Geomonas sp. Red32]
MDVLLVSANRERNPYPVFPLGLSFLAGPLERHGHRLRVLDLGFAADPGGELAAALDEFAPQVVALSLRNIDNVTYPGSRSYVAEAKELAERCRGRALVVLGGSGFSLMPVELMARLDADYGVVGEGEEALPGLLGCLERGEQPGSIPGVMARGGSVVPVAYLESFGAPDRRLFPLGRYRAEGGMANVQTKRGCPFSCLYCNYPFLEGRKVRLRGVSEIVDEVNVLVKEEGVDYFSFVDDVFNFPPEFAEQLCRALAREKLKVGWSAFINPGYLTPHLVDAMAEAGCDAIEFGSESGSDVVLEALGKSFQAVDLRAASRLARRAGIAFAHYFLFGGPGESEATVEETFAVADELDADANIAMTGIRIFPGTGLYHRALADGVITAETSLLEPVFYLSPPVAATLCALVADRALSRKNWVAPGMELNMSDAMLEALRRFPVRGPLWKQVRRLSRSRLKPM